MKNIFNDINNKFSDIEKIEIEKVFNKNKEKFLELKIDWNFVLRNLDFNNLEKSIIDRCNIDMLRRYYNNNCRSERPKLINN